MADGDRGDRDVRLRDSADRPGGANDVQVTVLQVPVPASPAGLRVVPGS